MAGAEHSFYVGIKGVTFQSQHRLLQTIQACHDNTPDAKVSPTMPLSASSLRTSLNYVFSIISSGVMSLSLTAFFMHAIIPHLLLGRVALINLCVTVSGRYWIMWLKFRYFVLIFLTT